jgi:hypothetical protein
MHAENKRTAARGVTQSCEQQLAHAAASRLRAGACGADGDGASRWNGALSTRSPPLN